MGANGESLSVHTSALLLRGDWVSLFGKVQLEISIWERNSESVETDDVCSLNFINLKYAINLKNFLVFGLEKIRNKKRELNMSPDGCLAGEVEDIKLLILNVCGTSGRTKT